MGAVTTRQRRISTLDAERLRASLERLYVPQVATDTLARLTALLEEHLALHPPRPERAELFDQRDVVLITYGDQVSEPGRAPLATLADFLSAHVEGTVTGLHILPFFPSTSDDGFAVSDYDAVDPALGTWDDIERLAGRYRLMVDAVFNHVSASSEWFRGWRRGDPRYAGFFASLPAGIDLSQVTRPRTSPLLTAVDTAHGQRRVWTTFSADQVDLDYSNPDVLLAVTRSLLHYLVRGAGIIRLDAVAFLWKQPGTTCIHLDQTHEIIRLWRSVVDAVAPGTLLITETNVPHAENVRYLGNGHDEAHLVYQFPLAPLVLSTFHLADAGTLREWATTLSTSSAETTFLNFLSSHDGIGVRPAEGLLTRSEINQLGDLARAHGGGVSFRAEPDGRLSPYELNTVFFDALTPVGTSEPLTTQVDRFLSAQSILLALAGVPAVYFHSLLGSTNWVDGVTQTGRLRTINRQKFDRRALERELTDVGSRRHQVFTRMVKRIATRTAQPAFHPNARQRILETGRQLFAFERTALDGSSRIVCVHNVSGRGQRFSTAEIKVLSPVVDLVSGDRFSPEPDGGLDVPVDPYGVRWLRLGPEAL
jgi:sucrose phosphorylase